MKKKMVIASLCLSLLGFHSGEAAKPNLSVYWEADGKDKIVLTQEAYEHDGQLWIPSEVVPKLNRKAKVMNGNQHVSIPMAKLRTEYKDLNRLLMRELDLSFQTQYKNGKHYFLLRFLSLSYALTYSLWQSLHLQVLLATPIFQLGKCSPVVSKIGDIFPISNQIVQFRYHIG